MRVIIALDSFKESMSAPTAVEAAAAGICAMHPEVTCIEMPISDGGEGLLEVLAPALELEIISCEVPNALGEPTTASYGLNAQTGQAVIEVAQAIGLEHIPPQRRQILNASSAGVGRLLLDAHKNGARNILIGLGGTATCDGGVGAFLELGGGLSLNTATMTATAGEGFDVRALQTISSLQMPDLSSWGDTRITLACDVSNPLTGPQGAAHVFAPQKGASPTEVPLLDSVLRHWGRLLEEATGQRVNTSPGAGAAGGLGAFFFAVFGATMKSGSDMVLDVLAFDKCLPGTDLIITGEGKIDNQTRQGKAPWGVLQRARAQHIPVIAVCGRRAENAHTLIGDDGFVDIVAISDPSTPLTQALKEGPSRIAQTCAHIVSQWMNNGFTEGQQQRVAQEETLP